MQIVNLTSLARTIAATDQLVEPGEAVEVDDVVAVSLLEQVDVWGPAPAPSKSNKK